MGEPEILIVGDSRAPGASWQPIENWRVRVVSESSADLGRLIVLANQALRPNSKVLIIMGFQCDLTQRLRHENGRQGLMQLKHPAPLVDLTTTLTSWDYEWRVKMRLSVVWTLPYVPNFELYNARQVRFQGIRHLCTLHTREARCAQRQMREDVDKFAVILRARRVAFIDLRPLIRGLEAGDGSDGLHLGPVAQKQLFSSVLEYSVAQYPQEPPNKLTRKLSLEQRLIKNLRKRRSRLRKRVRAFPPGTRLVQPSPHINGEAGAPCGAPIPGDRPQ